MKVIVSHDIDHIAVSDHFKDMIIPKLLVRNIIELYIHTISLKEFYQRIHELFTNKWQYIDEIMEFDKVNGVKSTFFIAVNNGSGLSYNLKKAAFWANRIIMAEFNIGVHGIEFDKLAGIKNEYGIFKNITGLNSFGNRLHYLRKNDKTINFLQQTGYKYDSSEYMLSDPYKIEDMWEFPLHIMDGYEIQSAKAWQSKKFDKIKDITKNKVEQIEKLNLKYLTILFHDRYFTDCFLTWKHWYEWIIDWFIQNNFQFIDYNDAIVELERE